jgi:hypothetical protein
MADTRRSGVPALRQSARTEKSIRRGDVAVLRPVMKQRYRGMAAVAPLDEQR